MKNFFSILTTCALSTAVFAQTPPPAQAPSLAGPSASAPATPSQVPSKSNGSDGTSIKVQGYGPKENGSIESVMPVDAVQAWKTNTPGAGQPGLPGVPASAPKGESPEPLPVFTTMKQAADAGVNPVGDNPVAPWQKSINTQEKFSWIDWAKDNTAGLFAGALVLIGGLLFSVYSKIQTERQNKMLEEADFDDSGDDE